MRRRTRVIFTGPGQPVNPQRIGGRGDDVRESAGEDRAVAGLEQDESGTPSQWKPSIMVKRTGVAFVRWATLCSHDYRDGIAPHTDW